MAGRISAGASLAGKSWRTVRREPAAVVAMLVGAIIAWSVGLVSFVLVFGRLPSIDDSSFPRYLLVFPFLWVSSFFYNVVACWVAILLDAKLSGTPMSRAEAARRTRTKLGRIVRWTLLAGFVGMVLYVIAERLHLAGRIAQWLVGLAWGLATTLVIPVLVLEDVSVTAAVRRSAQLFKRTWVEKVTADVTIGAASLVVFMPVVMVLCIVGFISWPVALVLGAVFLSVFTAVTSTLDTVLDLATYHYALDGRLSGEFTESDFRSLYKRA